MFSALQRRIAFIAKALGNLTESSELLERSLQIADRSLAACNPEMPAVLNDLATAVDL